MAERLVALYHGEEVALQEKEAFISQFSEKNKPEEIAVRGWSEFSMDTAEISLPDLLVLTELAPSKTEARRLIEQGGVRLNDQLVGDEKTMVNTQSDLLLQVGKRRFIRLQS